MSAIHTIPVNLGTTAYPIHIGNGLLSRLGNQLSEILPGKRLLLVIDSNIRDFHGMVAEKSLRNAGFDLLVYELEAKETAKTLTTCTTMYDAMLKAKLDRSSAVVAVGGGIVGDVAGFVAATYLRGIPVVQVPTTLLAMVDASVGGKTGVNFPLPGGDQLGKNMIGAFWQPRAVFADPAVLTTLNPRIFRCGLAECVKHAMIDDGDLLPWIEQNATAIQNLDSDTLTDLIIRCVSIKVGIVEEDEREAGRRALLNLGHTFAHAIEPIESLDLYHGEAVSIGLAAAMHCAENTGRMVRADGERVRQLLQTLDLPVQLPHSVSIVLLLAAMRYDKKVSDGSLRLVLPGAIGRVEIVKDVAPELIHNSWVAVGAES